MDLDDSFSERLLQRAKARKDFVHMHKTESPQILSKKRSALVEEHQTGLSQSTDDSPKRQCVAYSPKFTVHEKENLDEEENEYIPFSSSLNGRGLAALKRKESDDDTSSQYSSDADQNQPQTFLFSTTSNELCGSRQSRLASLAANINQWEDNSKPKPPLHRDTANDKEQSKSNSCMKSPVKDLQVQNNSPVKSVKSPFKDLHVQKNSPIKSVKSPFKDLHVQNNSPVKSVKSPFKDLLVQNNSPLKSTKSPFKESCSVKSPVKLVGPGPNKILDKVAAWNKAVNSVFEPEEKNTVKPVQKFVPKLEKTYPKVTAAKKDDLNQSFEPSNLPLSARKALFENAMTGQNSKSGGSSYAPRLSVAQRAAMFETASKDNTTKPSFNNLVASRQISQSNCSPQKPPRSPMKSHNDVSEIPHRESPSKQQMPPPPPVLSPSKPANQGSVSTSWQLKATVPTSTEKKTEITSLVNHWEKLSSSSSVGNSEEEQSVYPSETQDDSNYEESEIDYESESEYTGEPESHLATDGMSRTQSAESSLYSEYKETSMEEDEYKQDEEKYTEDEENYTDNGEKYTEDEELQVFDESVSGDEQSQMDVVKTTSDVTESETCDEYYTCPSEVVDKMSIKSSSSSTSSNFSASKSISYSSYSSSTGSYSDKSSLNSKSEEAGGLASNLQYTVSFYRKQRSETRTPPMQTIVRKVEVEKPTAESVASDVRIQEQIKLLQDEITKQQNIIGQTSQALNLCHATVEFSGSSEQIEGERLLLIATQKRQACMNEIQRLKSHGAKGQDLPEGIGTLTITDIRLPLKRDFLAAQLEGKNNDTVHCFLCLIRHGAQVIVTQMVSTEDKVTDGALCFTNFVKLQNLPPDFSVVFEVYGLTTKKENLPHDKKYHIKKDSGKIRLTPKGRKADGKHVLPAIQSPGGPHVVRSPSFSVIGYTRFTIQNCHKKCFTLDKVPFVSPLESILKVKLHMHADFDVKERGFLTMFEDVSGFGAWHRRWCYLNGHHVSYWKYPDDEQTKEPVGTIDLKQCVTSEVKLVSRDVCARPHTFQLVTVRPQAKGDRDTLISKKINTLTSTKHLLSADTKEERILWCNKLNEALTNVRKWDPQALRPVELPKQL